MRRTAVLASLALAAASLLWSAGPSSATTLDSFTVSPQDTAVGTTVTFTASWTSSGAEAHFIEVLVPQALIDAGASWAGDATSSLPTSPSNICGPLSAGLGNGCAWESSAAGQTNVVTAVLTVPAATTPGAYVITARSTASVSSSVTQTRTLTLRSKGTAAVTLSPTAIEPGGSSTATAVFTAQSTGDIRVTVSLEGTEGTGTLGAALSASGLTGCALDVSQRSYSCTWSNAVIGQTRTIQIPVNAGADALSVGSYSILGCANGGFPGGDCDTQTLTITSVAPSTSPSPSASPSTSASPSAEPTSSDPAVPTAVPAGRGADGTSMPIAGVLVALGVAGALSLALSSRRAGRRQL